MFQEDPRSSGFPPRVPSSQTQQFPNSHTSQVRDDDDNDDDIDDDNDDDDECEGECASGSGND